MVTGCKSIFLKKKLFLLPIKVLKLTVGAAFTIKTPTLLVLKLVRDWPAQFSLKISLFQTKK